MMRATKYFALAGVAFLFALTTAGAAESTTAAAPLQAPSLAFSFARVIGALAIVFGVFLGGLWLFRNWQRLTVQSGRSPKLNVLEVKSLGARHALYVIGYEQQRFLLSSAPTGVSMLTELPTCENDAAELPSRPLQPKFSEFLMKAINRK